jgi:putative transposase
MASTFTNLIYHIVFSTKFRRSTIATAWQPQLYEYLGGILRERDGICLQIGGMPDHVHILAKLSPKIAIMDVLRDVKAVSSKWINDQRYMQDNFEWQIGYGAFSVSRSNVKSMQQYIQDQATHHQRLSFKAEFIAFLRRHEVDFDLKYVFEEEHIS